MFLSGYKTYIISGLIVLFSVLYAGGAIEMEVFLKLLGVFGGAASFSMRHAVAKIENKQSKDDDIG